MPFKKKKKSEEEKNADQDFQEFVQPCLAIDTCKLLVPQPSTVTVPPVTAAPARK